MSKKHIFSLFILLLLSSLLVAACSSGATPEDNHTDEEHIEPPVEFSSLTNRFAGDHEAAEAGAEIYEVNCASCHGPEGEGNGPTAEALDPKPASLADAHLMEDMSDGALFWRVSEGGMMEPFNSAMPAWKETLSEEEIWQVITFIREFAEDDHD
jgi:mono/diheme cytochrome c family protein